MPVIQFEYKPRTTAERDGEDWAEFRFRWERARRAVDSAFSRLDRGCPAECVAEDIACAAGLLGELSMNIPGVEWLTEEEAAEYMEEYGDDGDGGGEDGAHEGFTLLKDAPGPALFGAGDDPGPWIRHRAVEACEQLDGLVPLVSGGIAENAEAIDDALERMLEAAADLDDALDAWAIREGLWDGSGDRPGLPERVMAAGTGKGIAGCMETLRKKLTVAGRGPARTPDGHAYLSESGCILPLVLELNEALADYVNKEEAAPRPWVGKEFECW